MRKYNRRKKNNMFLLVLLILGISIGFALLSTTLNINGIAGINKNTWDIHWNENSIVETQGSVTATTPAYVSDTAKKNVTFAVELELPGDFYEFTVDAKNYGTISGLVDDVKVKIYEGDSTTPLEPGDIPEYLVYSFTHIDGSAVQKGEEIKPNESTKYKFKIGIDEDYEEVPVPGPTPDPAPTTLSLRVEVEETFIQSTSDEDDDPYNIGDFLYYDPVNYNWCEEGDGGTCYKWYLVGKEDSYYDLYMYEHMTNSRWNQTNPVDCIKTATTTWSNQLWIDPKYDYQVSSTFNLDFSTAKARLLTSQEYNALPTEVISSIYAYDQIQQHNSMLINYETQQFNWDGPTEASSGIPFTAGMYTGFYIHPVIHVAKKEGGSSDKCGSYRVGKVVYFDPISTDTCNANTYDINKVKSGQSTCYRWRTIKNDSNCEVTLQLDHNIVNRAVWTSRYQAHEEIGPDNVLTQLQQSTSSWTRVPLLNYEYDTSDVIPTSSEEVSCQDPNDPTKLNRCYYGTLACVNGTCNMIRYNESIFSINNMRARAITAEEVRNIVNTKADSNAFSQTWTIAQHYLQGGFAASNLYYEIGSHYTSGTGNTDLSWLYENTWYTDQDRIGITASDFYDGTDATYNGGYWTLSPMAGHDNYAWAVKMDNGGLDYGTAYNWNGSIFGVRPVIKISKELTN